MPESLPLELSEAADLDLVDIHAYTTSKFGQAQADDYLLGIEELFVSLTSNPIQGKERNEIKQGLRGIPYVAHLVFYRILPDRLRIVRVIHASRDLPKHLG
jgi:toxin ParE1/3/4